MRFERKRGQLFSAQAGWLAGGLAGWLAGPGWKVSKHAPAKAFERRSFEKEVEQGRAADFERV